MDYPGQHPDKSRSNFCDFRKIPLRSLLRISRTKLWWILWMNSHKILKVYWQKYLFEAPTATMSKRFFRIVFRKNIWKSCRWNF